MAYQRVQISAPSKEEAKTISRTLVEKKLVAGTLITSGQSNYWWENKVQEKTYWEVGAFTLEKHKDCVIDEVRKVHSDICPVIYFFAIDGNADFLEWIDDVTL